MCGFYCIAFTEYMLAGKLMVDMVEISRKIFERNGIETIDGILQLNKNI